MSQYPPKPVKWIPGMSEARTGHVRLWHTWQLGHSWPQEALTALLSHPGPSWPGGGFVVSIASIVERA